MVQSPKYKIYRGKEYVGCVKTATDAAVLVSVQTDGTVRLGHQHILWKEEVDGWAGESYDHAAEVVLERENQPINRRIKNKMNIADTAVENVKQVFERETKGLSTSDYIDVCSELADEFQTRADAAQADLDREEGDG